MVVSGMGGATDRKAGSPIIWALSLVLDSHNSFGEYIRVFTRTLMPTPDQIMNCANVRYRHYNYDPD